MNPPSNFSYFLAYVMKKNGVPPKTLAEHLGWPMDYLKGLVDGTTPPPALPQVGLMKPILKCNPLEGDLLDFFASGGPPLSRLLEDLKRKDQEIETLRRNLAAAPGQAPSLSVPGAAELLNLFSSASEKTKKVVLFFLKTGKIEHIAKIFE
jgi:hypothetical protein